MQKQLTISWSDFDVWWKVDFIWQLVMTSSVVGPRRSSKTLPKAKLAPKKGHGHCLMVCCLSDPLLLLLLSHFSRVRLCATPEMAAHQAPPFLGFSRQEHWSGLPFPSPMHESEKWKGSRSDMSDSPRPHGLQPTRLLRPWDSPGKSGVGCHCLLHYSFLNPGKTITSEKHAQQISEMH